MLILELKAGQRVSLVDTKHNEDLGAVKFLGLRATKQNTILLGFECPDSVTVLRDTLLHGEGRGRR